jgi:hypothetical protein
VSTRNLIRNAAANGWTVSNSGGHLRLEHPSAKMPVFIGEHVP